MRKLFLCVIILILCLLSGCTGVEIEGIKNFSEETSSVGLTKYLIPEKEFLQNYEYISADYHYKEEKPFSDDCLEVTIIALRYKQDEYKKAKEYCLKSLELSDVNSKQYNSFTFLENLDLPYAYDNIENGSNSMFPYHFTMFAYNDDLCELVSIGFYCGINLYEEANLLNEDFDAFIQKYYGNIM